jgi:ribonucleoside-diphosphate reductase alpha chain
MTWNQNLNPLKEQRDAAKLTRRLGLGVVGIADMLNQLGIGYDSDEGIKHIEKVMEFIANSAYEASALLADERGSFPLYNYEDYSKSPFFQERLREDVKELVKEKGLRNVALLSIAPTGTISNIVLGFQHNGKNYVGVSGGVEPIFALYYTRRSESFGNVFFKVFHSTVQAYIDMNGLTDEAKNANEDELRKILPEYFFRTAHNINANRRVEIQGVCQRFIDQSISSTVNLPEDIDPETISNIYLNAWKNRLKGITIYREGSRYPILQADNKKTDFQEYKEKTFKLKDPEGNVIEGKGDTIITLPDGKLTTIYHIIKESKEENGE